MWNGGRYRVEPLKASQEGQRGVKPAGVTTRCVRACGGSNRCGSVVPRCGVRSGVVCSRGCGGGGQRVVGVGEY